MHAPIRRAQMNLYIPDPKRGTDLNFRIKEVGPRIAVLETGFDDLDVFTGTAAKLLAGKQAELPYKAEKILFEKHTLVLSERRLNLLRICILALIFFPAEMAAI